MLVTAGGGGDGFDLMVAVLAAVKCGTRNHLDFLFVLGPFMIEGQRFESAARASGVKNVRVIDFDTRLETIVANAHAVIGMCGYNTFCEVISFD